MARKVTIVTYHYVRPIKNSRFPEMKGVELEDFKEQVRFLLKRYRCIRMEMLMESAQEGRALPDDALLLTFDDAYADHFQYVFPVLKKLGIQGSFFVPAEPLVKHTVLDVNKIHFILASNPNKKALAKEIADELRRIGLRDIVEKNKYFAREMATAISFDDEDVIFIKRMLQKEIPGAHRTIILNKLFEKHVTDDERLFSSELYMSTEQVASLQRNDMYIGSHAYSHRWVDALGRKKQELEITRSLQFLRSLGADDKRWAISFPYGRYDDTFLHVIKKNRCIIGVTVKPGVADLDIHNALTLPRVDAAEVSRR